MLSYRIFNLEIWTQTMKLFIEFQICDTTAAVN